MVKWISFVITKKDIRPQFSSDIQYENWIAGQLRAKRIMKVRKGLYVLVDATGEPMATKFEIASKITDDAFLCYHSALEFYGVVNQVFNTMMMGSNLRFNSFTFLNVDYIRKQPNNDYGIVYIKQAGVRVTTLERTVIVSTISIRVVELTNCSMHSCISAFSMRKNFSVRFMPTTVYSFIKRLDIFCNTIKKNSTCQMHSLRSANGTWQNK